MDFECGIKASMQRWLHNVTRAIDEDTAIVPDDELVFTVKPRVDPSQQLVKNEYSTALKVSASGVSVCAVTAADELVERFFWCYTDFLNGPFSTIPARRACKFLCSRRRTSTSKIGMNFYSELEMQ